MQVCRSIPELREARAALPQRLAFVPTMGALHAGHLSLVKLARAHSDVVAASVFVNPTQFNDASDFQKYPRTLDDDLRQLEAAGVDLVFAPEATAMYPADEVAVSVDVPALTRQLEGAHRPGHFEGVCRVVLKLFHLVQPSAAVFGMKDFQQLRIIEAMTSGLNLPIEIVRGPTLRDSDGLAMSSRNRRLSAEERERAVAIPRGLEAAEVAFDAGEHDAAALVEIVRTAMAEVKIDYVAAVDAERLEPVETMANGGLLAVAAHVGPVRLIDNRLLS